MKLRGIEFGPVLDASGARNFFGKGYPHHTWWGPLRPRFTGSTFVSKTATLHPTAGNMPSAMTDDDFMPRERFPRCVVVKFRGGHVLNAVGLTNPGLDVLTATGRWNRIPEPFFISVMAVNSNRKKRKEEMTGIAQLLEGRLGYLRGTVGLQINYSCPNAGLKSLTLEESERAEEDLIDEIRHGLDALGSLGVPLMAKFNVLMPIHLAKLVTEHPHCDAICISNTLSWGTYPNWIPWEEIFGSDVSPLLRRGLAQAGAYSGPLLLPLVAEWVDNARRAGIVIPMNSGGGITKPADVDTLCKANHYRENSSIFVGSIAITRPWRVGGILPWRIGGIIRRGHELFGKEVSHARKLDYSYAR